MVNTPASVKVTGAVGVWCGVGPNKAMLGLGYGREPPRVRRNFGWVPVFTDLGGPAISFDELFANEEALVSVTLNLYRSDTLGLVEAVAGGGVGMTTPAAAMGALAVGEGLAYPLALAFPRALTPVYKAAGGPAGFRLFAAKVESIEYSPGLKPLEVSIIWKAKSVFNPANGSFVLGDGNLTGISLFVV